VSPRENARAKGIRMLGEGRLLVERVDGDLIVASCRGDSGEIYFLGHDPREGAWRCTCPAKTTCSHLAALQLVTVRRRR
jgi:uncharacterized Zn finger protein